MEEEREAWQQLVTKVKAHIIHPLLILLNKTSLDEDETNLKIYIYAA